MRALLDVNVLIALLDSGHLHHQRASNWLEQNIEEGWASCPITQNGCVRIISQPAYPAPVTPVAAAERLRNACNTQWHQFWPDEVSALDTGIMHWSQILGSRQITDAYLLALAVRNNGCFVTLDRAVSIESVADAEQKHLVKI